jgi:hypothetical protein
MNFSFEASALLSSAAYRPNADSTAGDNDLTASLAGTGWAILRPSQLGLSTLDSDNEYFETRVGSSSGPQAGAFLAPTRSSSAIALRGSDETGDQLATVNNQSGYFDAYGAFVDASLLYASNPANEVTEIGDHRTQSRGVMPEWMANAYAAEIAAVKLPTSILTFGSPGTNNANPPS